MNETQYINSITPTTIPELNGSTNWCPQQMAPYLLDMFCAMGNVTRPVFDAHFIPRQHTSGRDAHSGMTQTERSC